MVEGGRNSPLRFFVRNPPRQSPDDALAPTGERRTHGLIERLPRPIADEAGRPARPYRAVDTLATMERRGTITAAMRQAGEDFRRKFSIAQLDPLHAADFQWRPRAQSSGPQLRTEAARDAVWRALLAVGGLASPAGSCLWHVVGWEQSLKHWALEQQWRRRPVDPETASGVLVATLGMLAAYYHL